jgi:hypothetical protein
MAGPQLPKLTAYLGLVVSGRVPVVIGCENIR